MKAFGVSAEADFERGDFRVPGGQAYQPRRYHVEGDWSGAAFLLVAGAIAGKVTVSGLDSGSLQADRSILRVLRQCGAQVSDSLDSVSVSTGPLSAFDFDARDAPDLFPPLAVLACYCRGTSRIHGTHRLRHKESARAEALLDVLGRMGAKIQVKGNVLEIAGAELKGGRVDSHHDHRIAMAAAVAALGSQGGAEIIHPECVAKSYPGFFDDLTQLRKTGGRA
jgi:3-phosphoshikimate 1-carboxyvinyltransferase